MSDNEQTNLALRLKLEELDTKIERINFAISQISDDHPNMPRLLLNLGSSHANRFDLVGELNDIDKAIEHAAMALTLTSDADQDLPQLLGVQGMYHDKRFKQLGEADDNDKAIEYVSVALALTPDGHPLLPNFLVNLGLLHSNRFERLGQPSDLEKEIEYQSLAATLLPIDHPGLSILLMNLGQSIRSRYERLGELNDLEKVIEHESRAVAFAPDRHPHLSAMLMSLGKSIGIRYNCLGILGDLDKSIEYESHAVALTPDGDPDLSTRLYNLGISIGVRYNRLGKLGDLDKAIEYESRALALTPDGHPDLPARFLNLGVSLKSRFDRVDDLGDLQKAIEYESRAIALIPDGHPHLSLGLQNLGVFLWRRFDRLGDLSDLDNAIEHSSRAVAMTPDGHPEMSNRLQNLGGSHSRRFNRLGEIADLEKAIEYNSRGVAVAPDGHPELSGQLQNLGGSLRKRFEHLGDLGDLEKAIEYESRAVALTPDGHPDLPARFINLGASLGVRYRRLGNLGDLEKAIEHQSRAIELTANDHPNLSLQLFNLGISYDLRFRNLHEQRDLQSAIDWISCSIELTQDGHPDLPGRYWPLAGFRFSQYRFTSDPSDLRDSLNSYRMGSKSSSGSPRDKFRCALDWAKNASKESYLKPIEAYQTAIDLLPQFIWLGATTVQRYEDLKDAESLAVDAATAAIFASDYRLALEWLEHARCVVWSQGLMLRSPLDDLASYDPDLATRLQTVAAQLHDAGSQSRESQSLTSGSLTPEQAAQRHRHLAQEYDKLISQARTLPGFADFLRPKETAHLVRAARYGPVVMINCHEERCDALIIMPGQDHIHHIPLPHFTAKRAQDIRNRMTSAIIDTRQRERGAELFSEVEQEVGFESILADLWYDIVNPVLGFLGFTEHSPAGNQPHITWCPTGALSFLPLHAAGDYDKPGSRVFDYVISSYTPTLTAILPPSTSGPVTGAPRVLAIAQPSTPGHTRLPGTAEELEYLQNHALGKLECTQLVSDEATTATVLDAMEQHDWVHLACHAHQNVQDSTKSGFFLHDGTLDLATINRRSFENKGLAFLSACQTATGDEKLPDEAIHLASGMLMAGYSSVIGTMWSVMDDDAPFVADKVYGQLMRDGKVGNGEAGKALHYAVAELRERVGEKKFGRWVPYIHIGS